MSTELRWVWKEDEFGEKYLELQYRNWPLETWKFGAVETLKDQEKFWVSVPTTNAPETALEGNS